MRSRSVKTLMLVTAVALTGVLAGCTSGEVQGANTGHGCVPRLSGGALTANVAVLGGFGTDPTVAVPKELTAAAGQSVIIDRAADRDVIAAEDAVVTINYALYRGDTGESIEKNSDFTSGRGVDFVPFSTDMSRGAFIDSLDCAAPGDRILMAFSEDEAASLGASMGLAAGTSIVGVIDVHDVVPLNLAGKTQNLPSGFPGVVRNSDGWPGIVTAPGKAPTAPRVALHIVGEGTEVLPTDRVVANVLQVTWQGELVESTWQSAGPKFLGTVEQPASEARMLINGAPVGSQVVYLQPTGDGTADIYVIDVLAAG